MKSVFVPLFDAPLRILSLPFCHLPILLSSQFPDTCMAEFYIELVVVFKFASVFSIA
jgi:hypothetical protein